MYEKDQREPSVDDIRKLANALNVHPSWLAFGENIAGEISVEERAVLIAFRGLEDQHKHVFVQLLRGPEVVPAYRGKERRKGERPRRRDPTVIQKLPLKLPFRD